MEGLQCHVTELESECDRERVVREEAQRDRDRLKVGWGVHCTYCFVHPCVFLCTELFMLVVTLCANAKCTMQCKLRVKHPQRSLITTTV